MCAAHLRKEMVNVYDLTRAVIAFHVFFTEGGAYDACLHGPYNEWWVMCRGLMAVVVMMMIHSPT